MSDIQLDSIVTSIIQKFTDRAQFGKKKYGTDLKKYGAYLKKHMVQTL